MNKKAISLTMGIVITAIVILVFIFVSSQMSIKIPGLFSTVTSPLDDVCCCDKALIDCEIKIKPECKQTIQPTETCTQRGIK